MKAILNKSLRGANLCLLLFAAALALAAQNPLARFEKGIDEGNFAGVEKDLFNYVVANPKDAKGFLLLAKMRLKQKRLSEAKSLSQKALTLDPGLLAAKLNLATAHFQAGEVAQARLVLSDISDAGLADNALRLTVAQTFATVGDCPKALVLTEKLPVRIRNGEALALRAACYLEANDRKNLESLIPLAKAAVRQNPPVVVGLAEILSQAGLYREAAELLRPVVLLPAKNARALVLLAKSEIYLKDFPNAGLHLAEAEKLNPQTAELRFVKALLETERGDTKQAMELLEKSLADDPHNVQMLGQFVVAAMRAGYSSKAARAAAKLIELEPANLDFLYLYGAAALQNKNLPEAESALKKFLESRPNDSKACVAYGLTLAAQTEKLEPAQQQMRECLAADPNNYEAAYQLGLSYRALGDSAKAVEYFEETVRISPNYAVALRDLGTVYLQTGAEAKARGVLEKAVALNPEDAETHFQMSRVYNVLGERELAKKHLDIFQKLKNPKKDGM